MGKSKLKGLIKSAASALERVEMIAAELDPLHHQAFEAAKRATQVRKAVGDDAPALNPEHIHTLWRSTRHRVKRPLDSLEELAARRWYDVRQLLPPPTDEALLQYVPSTDPIDPDYRPRSDPERQRLLENARRELDQGRAMLIARKEFDRAREVTADAGNAGGEEVERAVEEAAAVLDRWRELADAMDEAASEALSAAKDLRKARHAAGPDAPGLQPRHIHAYWRVRAWESTSDFGEVARREWQATLTLLAPPKPSLLQRVLEPFRADPTRVPAPNETDADRAKKRQHARAEIAKARARMIAEGDFRRADDAKHVQRQVAEDRYRGRRRKPRREEVENWIRRSDTVEGAILDQ